MRNSPHLAVFSTSTFCGGTLALYYLHRSCPWTFTNQICHGYRGRRRNRVWQIFGDWLSMTTIYIAGCFRSVGRNEQRRSYNVAWTAGVDVRRRLSTTVWREPVRLDRRDDDFSAAREEDSRTYRQHVELSRTSGVACIGHVLTVQVWRRGFQRSVEVACRGFSSGSLLLRPCVTRISYRLVCLLLSTRHIAFAKLVSLFCVTFNFSFGVCKLTNALGLTVRKIHNYPKQQGSLSILLI